MASQQDTVTLTANCLCKAHVFQTQVRRDQLPLAATACHCDSCRHVTGALYSIDAPWPEPRANVDVSRLKAFHFSDSVHVLFCGTCSTPMFFGFPQDSDKPLGVFTGTIQNDPGDLVKIEEHIFVGDTKDGGASMWLRKVNADGSEAPRYKERKENDKGEPGDSYPFEWPSADDMPGFHKVTSESLPIRCKCKGVDLVLHRGNYEGKSEKDLPWFIDPETHKLLAGFCGCESCRLFGGVDTWTWAFAELENITFPDKAKQPLFPNSTADLKALIDAKDPSVGTLTYYASSPDVQRFFCSNCSACVFYGADDRKHMVDVAIGVLESPDGSRAEGFLSWAYGRGVTRLDENKGGWRHDFFVRMMEEGEEWRERRGYPKNWQRKRREDALLKAQQNS